MKRELLVKQLKDSGFVLLRTAPRHEIWSNGIKMVPLPRNREIMDMIARSILATALEAMEEKRTQCSK